MRKLRQGVEFIADKYFLSTQRIHKQTLGYIMNTFTTENTDHITFVQCTADTHTFTAENTNDKTLIYFQSLVQTWSKHQDK